MTPVLLTGLSVAVAFKAGLFNIGASGQFLMGSVFSVAVGVNFEGLPPLVHVTLALAAGVLGGVLWGAIPGVLKVFTGAHEVITTIMLNYIASLFAGWTVYAGGTPAAPRGRPRARCGTALRAPSRKRPTFLRVLSCRSSLAHPTGCTGAW